MSIVAESPVVASEVCPLIAQAVEFTETFKKYFDAHPAIREAMCLKTQYPALMGEIRPGDLFVSRHAKTRITYVGTMWWAAPPKPAGGNFSPTKQGGYCFDFELASRIGANGTEREILADLTAFWDQHCTWRKANSLYDDELNKYARKGNGQIGAGANGFCVAINHDRLLQRGIPGLKEDIRARRDATRKAGEETAFFDGIEIALEVVCDVARHYRAEAIEKARLAGTDADRARLNEIAKTLDSILVRKPETLREAIQLYWLYTHLVSGNHPEAFRIDVSLGDFYARDIDTGRLTEEQALELLLGLWRMTSENGADALCRMVIGGLGRRNPANADRFCLAAMETTRRHRRVTPQLTLRFHKNQDPRLLKKAYDTISEGCCYPMLYNDDVVVPGVMKSMHLPVEAAEHYYPLGCGEYMVGWMSPSVLCCGWSIPKSLDAALHNGFSDGHEIGPKTGAPESFHSFEKLYDAFLAQLRFSAELSAKAYRRVLDGVPRECPFLLASLLTDDCLKVGKGILEGSRYVGACVMAHGFTNAADALVAIRQYVYQEKRFTLKELIAALDANFEGHEEMRKLLLAAPKFGNDDAEADGMLVTTWDHINAYADEAGMRQRLPFHIVSSVNPGGYFMGESCGATADGRKRGEHFAIGHAPTAGKDTSGLTALMNSVAKASPANGGATTNFKLSRDLFTRSRPKVESMFASYFENGGQEATITVVNRDDLQNAMKEPEKYQHVLVRLGGWCAKFVDLSRPIQEEIIKRTLY